MKLLAQVPYDTEKSYDFYEDRLVVDGSEFKYEDIDGYGYLLMTKSTSINLIPVGNSTSYSFHIFEGDQEYRYDKSAGNVMLFKNKKQKTINVIFTELVTCVQTFIAPGVFAKNLNLFKEQGWLTLAGLTLSEDTLIKKTMFGQKELHLSEYGQTVIAAGRVKVYNANNKLFYDGSLSEYNAPLMGAILDTLVGK